MFQIFQFSVRKIFMKRYIVSSIYFYLHFHNFVFCQYGSQPIVVRVCNVWILNRKSLNLYCHRSQPVQLHHVKSGTQIRGCPYITSAAITRQGQLECLQTLTLGSKGSLKILCLMQINIK